MLLFNLAGYYFVFAYFIERSDTQLVQQLDNNQYSESELLELKIALHLPYVTGPGTYERVDGEIAFGGMHYNYVKRKVANDTLYLLCLPNKNKTRLYKARNEYAFGVNDIPAGERHHSLFKRVSISNEYRQQGMAFSIVAPVVTTQPFTPRFSSQLVYTFLAVEHQPPQTCS